MHYEIINPIIIGTLQTKYESETPLDAAKQFWLKMSKIIVNEIPQTFFSLRDSKGKIYHFKVSERRSSDNVADFMVTEYDKIDDSKIKKMTDLFTQMKSLAQKGGKKHWDDDDDSSDIDDAIIMFNKINKISDSHPIVYFHYIPHIYDSDTLFIPTFIYPYMPLYVEIGFSPAFWKRF